MDQVDGQIQEMRWGKHMDVVVECSIQISHRFREPVEPRGPSFNHNIHRVEEDDMRPFQFALLSVV